MGLYRVTITRTEKYEYEETIEADDEESAEAMVQAEADAAPLDEWDVCYGGYNEVEVEEIEQESADE